MKFYRVDSKPMCAIVRVEDFPEFDADTADGKDEFTAIAFSIHHHDPKIAHVTFTRGGEEIGEIFVGSAFDLRQ